MFSDIKKNYEFYKKNFYRGKDIYCPFCSGSYKAQKYQFTKETNTDCPVCGSTIQERTILLFLQAKTEILPGEPKILVIAEEGKITEYFSNFPNAEVKIFSVTGDLSIKDNIMKNVYDSGFFDLIVCNYIIEKLPIYVPVLKEIVRILKPDGLVMLLANINYEKDRTDDFPLTEYRDRILAYGIAGNYRRYGKDYCSLIKANGLNISKLKFSSGFDELPALSFDKEEIFYLAHKTDQPVFFDNMDDLEAEMSEQRSNYRGSSFSAFSYTVFFILPEMLRKILFAVLGNISENEENKGKFSYMFYILIIGLITYWTALAIFVMLKNISMVYWFFGVPVWLTLGLGGASIMAGYVFLNDKAGFLKKSIVGIFLFISLLLPLGGYFFK